MMSLTAPDLPSLLSLLASSFDGFKSKFAKILPVLGVTGPSLVPLVFQPLPLGSISPSGWLKDQMQLSADGLAGHLHDFYNPVANSVWLGKGMEYSGLNEALPYWFNGLVPLAYGLDDTRLKDQVHGTARYILDHAWDDGWIGPEHVLNRNFWGRMPLFLGLTALSDADPRWEARVVPALLKFNTLMNSMLKRNYTGYLHEGGYFVGSESDWGRVRHQEMLLTLQWLYENHQADQGELLLENMKMLHDAGLRWEDWYNEWAYFGQGMDQDLTTLDPHITEGENFPFEHGVNVAQGRLASGEQSHEQGTY